MTEVASRYEAFVIYFFPFFSLSAEKKWLNFQTPLIHNEYL